MNGINVMASTIAQDMHSRLPRQRKTQREKLSLAVAALLTSRSVNLMELGAALPLETGNRLSRFQWLKRLMGNDHVRPAEVLAPYAREVLGLLHASGERIVLILDQTTLTTRHRHEMAMLAVRFCNRALPLAWVVKRSTGAISIPGQTGLLDRVAGWMPEGARPVLMADRYYGGRVLLRWCHEHGWSFRLRLRDRTEICDSDGVVASARSRFDTGERFLHDVRITRDRLPGHIGMIHKPGYAEPWIIAASEPADDEIVADYAGRWGIEAMFSDLKSRGFNVEDSHLRKADRLERLMLLLALAMYWIVSTGLHDKHANARENEKKHAQTPPKAPQDHGYPASQEACEA